MRIWKVMVHQSLRGNDEVPDQKPHYHLHQLVLNLAVSPPDKSRGHFSQMQIASQLQISKGTVTTIIKNSGLKCYHRIQCHKLTDRHRNARVENFKAFIKRFVDNDEWKNIWFSEEAFFSLHVPLNRKNERVYREVTLKTYFSAEDVLNQFDKQQPSLHCTQLRRGMRNRICVSLKDLLTIKKISVSKRRKKTVNQFVYTQEMCPLTFNDIETIMTMAATWC